MDQVNPTCAMTESAATSASSHHSRAEISAHAASPKRKRTNATCAPGSRAAAALATTAMRPKSSEQRASTASAEAARGAFTDPYLAQLDACGTPRDAQLPPIMLPVRYWDDFL